MLSTHSAIRVNCAPWRMRNFRVNAPICAACLHICIAKYICTYVDLCLLVYTVTQPQGDYLPVNPRRCKYCHIKWIMHINTSIILVKHMRSVAHAICWKKIHSFFIPFFSLCFFVCVVWWIFAYLHTLSRLQCFLSRILWKKSKVLLT